MKYIFLIILYFYFLEDSPQTSPPEAVHAQDGGHQLMAELSSLPPDDSFVIYEELPYNGRYGYMYCQKLLLTEFYDRNYTILYTRRKFCCAEGRLPFFIFLSACGLLAHLLYVPSVSPKKD
jgi:hypothetical protein